MLYPGTDRPIKGVKSFANGAELSRAEEKIRAFTCNYSDPPGQHCERIEFFGFR
jgi:hypothetical protein